MFPTNEPFWNLQTVCCWIATGQARDVSLLRLQLEANYDGAAELAEELADRHGKAERSLIGALGRGQLIATGCECIPLDAVGQNVNVMARSSIEPDFWVSATIDLKGSRAKPRKQSLPHFWRFEDIRLDAEAVRAIWPPAAWPSVEDGPNDGSTEENMAAELRGKAVENPATFRRDVKADFQALGKVVQRTGRPGGTRRGPTPTKRDSIKAKMLADMKSGTNISAMKEVEMEVKYGASRDTCRSARNEALSELSDK